MIIDKREEVHEEPLKLHTQSIFHLLSFHIETVEIPLHEIYVLHLSFFWANELQTAHIDTEVHHVSEFIIERLILVSLTSLLIAHIQVFINIITSITLSMYSNVFLWICFFHSLEWYISTLLNMEAKQERVERFEKHVVYIGDIYHFNLVLL